jgi:hypothetical protein
VVSIAWRFLLQTTSQVPIHVAPVQIASASRGLFRQDFGRLKEPWQRRNAYRDMNVNASAIADVKSRYSMEPGLNLALARKINNRSGIVADDEVTTVHSRLRAV